jgi:hypothetical protein
MDASRMWPRLTRRACTCFTPKLESRLVSTAMGLPTNTGCCHGLEMNDGDAVVSHSVRRSWWSHESIRSIQCSGGIPLQCPETSEETETRRLVGLKAVRDWTGFRKEMLADAIPISHGEIMPQLTKGDAELVRSGFLHSTLPNFRTCENMPGEGRPRTAHRVSDIHVQVRSNRRGRAHG